jgi:hypothetical protein
VKQAGKMDIALDATGPLAKDYGNGKVAVELPIEEFMAPLATIVKSRFITSHAAARHMFAATFQGRLIYRRSCVENGSSHCSMRENEAKMIRVMVWKCLEKMAGTTGLEPATSDVTGRRSNQLNYVPALFMRILGW